MMFQWSVVGLAISFYISRIGNQFKVHSFSEAFHGLSKNNIVEIFVV